MKPSSRAALAAYVTLVLALAFGPIAWAHVRAVGLLLAVGGGNNTLTRLVSAPVVTEDMVLHGAYGNFRARIYRPDDGARHRGWVLAHGVHWKGIDEPRLVPFAQHLAATGLTVITPELLALTEYTVAPSSTDAIRVAVSRISHDPHASAGGVGVFGLSFAGGLALLAASNPVTRRDVRAVVAFGGHHDLARVSRFLATDMLETDHGDVPMHAHDYGLVIFFHDHADRFVSPSDRATFTAALREILHEHRPDGERIGQTLTGPARTLFDEIDRGDKSATAPLVLAAMPALRGEFAAVSPAGHLAGLAGLPVWLFHGAHDDVMPPSEAYANARELSRVADVHLVVSNAIKHVTVEGVPTMGERWALVHAMAGVLAE